MTATSPAMTATSPAAGDRSQRGMTVMYPAACQSEVVTGALMLVLTAVASLVTALLLSRANPDQRLPLIGWPARRPAGFVVAFLVLIGLGAGLTPSLGRDGWGDGIWLWSLGAMLVPLLVIHVVHNRRLKSTSVD